MVRIQHESRETLEGQSHTHQHTLEYISLSTQTTSLLVFSLLRIRKGAPTLAELLSDLTKGQVGQLRLDSGACLLGEEHVAGKLLLSTLG